MNKDVTDLVKQDLEDRAVVGEKKYGRRLIVGVPYGNDLVSWENAYQEVLDLACYMKKEIEDQKLEGVFKPGLGLQAVGLVKAVEPKESETHSHVSGTPNHIHISDRHPEGCGCQKCQYAEYKTNILGERKHTANCPCFTCTSPPFDTRWVVQALERHERGCTCESCVNERDAVMIWRTHGEGGSKPTTRTLAL